jgi:hypothetical protein
MDRFQRHDQSQSTKPKREITLSVRVHDFFNEIFYILKFVF